MVMQAVCKCGRIAEVKRRKNGKHLRYLVCKKCGVQLGDSQTAAELERVERENIGELGEFFEQEDKRVQSSKPVAEKAAADWVPDSDCLPDADRETEPEKAKAKTDSKLGFGLKVFAVSISLLSAAAGLKIGFDKFSKMKAGA